MKDLKTTLEKIILTPLFLIPVSLIFIIIFGILGIASLDNTYERTGDNLNEIEIFDYNETSVDFIRDDNSVVTITTEIADTDEKRTRGLMYRQELEQDRGMIFSFDTVEERTFWMKNVEIYLDIIFINENKEIVKIYHNALPHDDRTNVYKSEFPIKYAIEVNGSWSMQNNINVGDIVSF